MAAAAEATGPNFANGIPLGQAAKEAVVRGHVDGEPVLLARFDGCWSAVSAVCTHYGAALSEGLVVGDTVRCPLHHACFSLRTGEALAAPAFDPLDVWDVKVEDGSVFVRRRSSAPKPKPQRAAKPQEPRRVVIVGGGAAGFAAAEMLRRRGYSGQLTLVSAEEALPTDRPNLSKDYLAGTAPEAWMPLKGEDFYRDHDIDLRLGAQVAEVASRSDEVILRDGARLPFDALLLATGAEPVRLAGPGFDAANVLILRTLADARAIIAAVESRPRVAVVGASFIGLEVAGALRTRGLEVHVVAPETVPMARILGPELGAFVRGLHEAQGVVFHLGKGVEGFSGGRLRLSGGDELDADLVVLGVGVRPRTELATAAGIVVDRGVVVDSRFQTSRPRVFAAGDVARYPDPRSGELIRVEHWVAAERQGQAAALSLLGEGAPFSEVPFFWSNHYETAIRYVGVGAGFDRHEVSGSLEKADAEVLYFRAGALVAAATIGRDQSSLRHEAELGAAAATELREPSPA